MSDAKLNGAMAEMRQQLRSLASCLGREQILADQTVFFGVLEMLGSSKAHNGVVNWKYALGKTEIKLDAKQVRWPENTSAFVCVFDFTIVGRICDGTSLPQPKRNLNSRAPAQQKRKGWEAYVMPKSDVCWIVDGLSADLQLVAHSGGTPKWEQFWHFDRHISGSPSVAANAPLEMPPLFHFHFGGNGLAERRASNNSAWGNLLELHAPRIAHPPLDLVLLVDFLLSNFAGEKWRHLVDTKKDYHEIVEAAQRRFWCPYKGALSDYFAATPQEQNDHLARELWPSLARTSR
jgi:hypothetical protein